MIGVGKDQQDLLAEYQAFRQGPRDGHVAGIDDKAKMSNDVRDVGVPFLVVQTTRATIVLRMAKKHEGGSDALVHSGVGFWTEHKKLWSDDQWIRVTSMANEKSLSQVLDRYIMRQKVMLYLTVHRNFPI